MKGQPAVMEGPLVAIIDDDLTSAWAISLVLKDLGYRTIYGRDEKEVLAQIEDSKLGPDALVTDYHLATTDGLAAAETIIEWLGKEIPVVIISGSSTSSEELRRQEKGFGVLTKPVDPDQLLRFLPEL